MVRVISPIAAARRAASAGASPRIAYAALVAASIAVGVGECFYTTVLSPLVADLAPPALRGRYMAVMGLAWWAGLAIAPTLGAQLLAHAPAAVFLAAAGAGAGAGADAPTTERTLPEASRLTPHPGGVSAKKA